MPLQVGGKSADQEREFSQNLKGQSPPTGRLVSLIQTIGGLMFIFRSVNNFALIFFGPLFYLIPVAIYGILKYTTKDKPLPEGYASFEKRALAFVIDFALIEGIALCMNLWFAKMTDPPLFLGGVFIIAFAFFNMAILPAKTGWTLGKKAVNLKIVKKGGTKPGMYDMLYREIVKSWFSLSVFFLGCFWMMIGNKQLTWHDSVADTFVVTSAWNKANNAINAD